MGALFLASGASTGLAAVTLLLFLGGGSAGEAWGKLKRADRFAIAFELVVLVLFLAALGSAGQPLTSGAHAPLFWGGLVVLGLLIPLGLELVGHGARLAGVLSAVLVLIGGFVLRYVMVMSIQS
jgi:formate-dependent nitrite reductase membrane component NrfD